MLSPSFDLPGAKIALAALEIYENLRIIYPLKTEKRNMSIGYRIFTLLFCFLCCEIHSQDLELPLTKIERDSIICNISQFFKEHYVFPEKGKDLARSLSKKNRQGVFDTIVDPYVFRSTVQAAIREVIDDKHIILIYTGHQDNGNSDTSNSNLYKLQREYDNRKDNNFGIPELRVLENNIGYIKITKFTSPELFGPVARASAEFLKNVEGLILDLRTRGGGHSDAVVLMLSYFLPPGTPVFKWKNRAGVEFERNWTLPYVDGHHFDDIPIVVLISEKTFSGSEAFSYVMKHHKAATLIGETTRGGAHSYMEMHPSKRFLILVPHQRIISIRTNQNWEGIGVVPSISNSAEQSFEIAKKELIEIIANNKRTKRQ